MIKFWKELNIKEKFLISGGIILGLFFLIFPAWLFWQNNFEKLPSEGGVLTEGFYQSVNTLNPFLAANPSEKALINLIFDKLIVDNGKGGFSYEIAKNITEFDRGLKFLVELKDDKLWSNREKITSDDLIFSFDTLKKYAPEEIKNLFRDIEIERIDNYQVFLTLKIRDNYFYNKLNQIYLVPKSVWQKYNPSDWQTQEFELLKVVSGPYIIAEKSDKKIVFVRNNFYYPRPYIGKIIFKIYPDLQTAVENLRIREIDAIGGIPSNILKSASSRRLKTARVSLPRVIGIFLNSKAVGNINIDRFDSLINKEKIKNDVFDGEAEITDGIFSSSIRKFLDLPELSEKSVLLSKIQQKTEQKEFEIVVPQNYFFQKITDLIAEKIPLKKRTEATENIYSNILPNKTYEALILGINYNLPPNLTPFFFENSPFNLINKSNQELSRLLQKLSIEQLNAKTYKDNLAKLEKEIMATGNLIFLTNPYYLYLIPKSLNGYNLEILRQPEERFAKIELWHLKTNTKWR